MAVLTDHKVVGGTAATEDFFSNEEKWISIDYNFANDTGAQADYDVFTAGVKMLVLDFYATVATTLAGATANIDLGVGAGAVELWSDYDGPALVSTTDAYMADAAFVPLLLAAAAKIVMGVETADLTAGIMTLHFKVKKL